MVSLAPGFQFLALAVAAVPLHVALRRRVPPPGAGAAVMAIGIFGSAALPEIPGGAAAVQQPLALALLTLWLLLAFGFADAWRRGRDPRHGPPLGRFALGTWPAGTVVTALLLHAALPGWTPLVAALGALAAGLWLWFLVVAGDTAPSLLHTGGEPLNGTVLLTAVATQGMALLAETLPFAPFPAIAFALIELGAFLYVALLVLLLRSFVRTRGFRLADDWHNGNCILHGAASITGLAAAASGQVPAAVCLAVWLYAGALFVIVEAIEIVRLAARLRSYGWRAGLLTYDVSQWARNFTFAMFYDFTRTYLDRFVPAADPSWATALQRAVLGYGQYVVLALLLVELALAAAGPLTQAKT